MIPEACPAEEVDISVVIPVYGCPEAVPELYLRLCGSLEKITKRFEIILVDDACPQNSWIKIENVCHKDRRVKGIQFSRNFGQMRAILAGLEYSKGDFVVVMDCDLQDPPEAIPILYEKLQEGYDVVFAGREGRQDGTLTKLLSRYFYRAYSYFTDGNFDHTVGNFSISRRKVIQAYCTMRESNRAFSMFIRWLGFRTVSIPVKAEKRFSGTSSYNFMKKGKLALEIITSQSNKPLYFSISIGFLLSFFSLCYILYLVIRMLWLGDAPAGWTTIVASIYLMGGLLLCSVGIVGIYVGNIFSEAKHRPLYIIRQVLNEKEKDT